MSKKTISNEKVDEINQLFKLIDSNWTAETDKIITKDTRSKQNSESKLGIKRSELFKLQQSIRQTGRKLSKEHIENSAKGNRGKKRSDETKEKIHLVNSGKKRSDETKENISLARKKLYKNGYINPRTGVHLTEEHKARLSNLNKGRKCSEETKNKMSEASKIKIKVSIENIIYSSILEASKLLNIPHSTIRGRIKSNNLLYKDWNYLDDKLQE